MRRLSGDDYGRLRAAMDGSQHLRGTRSITDLAFTHIEEADDQRHKLYKQIDELKAANSKLYYLYNRVWCVRVVKWFNRAIAKTFRR